MSKFSWEDPDMKLICGECHFKDSDPELCHSVEPPLKKPFIPSDTSSCSFVRESYWQRMPKERQDELMEFIEKRSERYYSKNKKTKNSRGS